MGFVKRHKVLCVVVGVVVVLVVVGLVLMFGVFRPFDSRPAAKSSSAKKCTSVTIVAYAPDSAACLEDVKSALARQVLSDGDVTAEEYQEVLDAYVSCLAAEGITATAVTPTGGAQFSMSRKVNIRNKNNVLINTCRGRSGVDFDDVGQKYNQETVNPDNLSGQAWTDAWIECFVRVGIEPKGFTYADYTQLSQEEGVELSEKPGYLDCLTDPLHTQR
jgi:hypothetical protein